MTWHPPNTTSGENNDETNDETMGHCPALGCCGHADAGCNVLVSTLDGDKKVCSHRVELAIFNETKHDKDYTVIIGINPKLAENIAESCLKADLVKNLINIKSYKREVKFKNSRFDFAGIDSDGVPFIMEIKNVPLADYVDVSKKDRKNYTELINNADFNDKDSQGALHDTTLVALTRLYLMNDDLEQCQYTCMTLLMKMQFIKKCAVDLLRVPLPCRTQCWSDILASSSAQVAMPTMNASVHVNSALPSSPSGV